MKKILLFALLMVLHHLLFAQAGEWTWMKGDSTAGSSGVFGTMGVPDPSNNPPALYEAAEFKDSLGNFWLFGGLHDLEEYNTLWKYDPLLNQWTWINGSNSPGQAGIYGTQGIPSPSNRPGARAWGATTWTDEHHNFWLFGGYGYDGTAGYGNLNDLWKFDVSTGEWTWISGSSQVNQAGVYGIQTIPDAANHPEARCETNASWLDSANNLWVFGGYNLIGTFNDLWKFDRSTLEWTWMKGSSSLGQPGVYGVLGISNVNNTPGARCSYTKWKDATGNFWLFGGWQPGIMGYTFNDVWKYTVSSNEWTWMSGTNIPYDPGSVTSDCSPAVFNIPASRFENRAAWNDGAGHFWTFGGIASEPFTDLWSFNSITLEWTLVSGSTAGSQPGFYGVQGTSSAFTYPASRFGAPGWKDDSCNLWLFGGNSWAGKLNDLWKFQPDPLCPGNFTCMEANNQQPQIAFSSSSTILCEKFCIGYFDSSSNNPFSWLWHFPGGNPSSSTDQNPTNICYNSPGTYDVTLITTNANGSDTLTLDNYITVYATPPFPTISQNGYTLTSSPADSYQWQLNAVDIPGATTQSYTIVQSGYYTVIVSDSNGCQNSASVKVFLSGIEDVTDDASILIHPNPAAGSFIVEWLNGFIAGEVSIDVMNTLGQIVFSSQESPSFGTADRKKEIDLSDVCPGIYFIEIKTENDIIRKKIVIAN